MLHPKAKFDIRHPPRDLLIPLRKFVPSGFIEFLFFLLPFFHSFIFFFPLTSSNPKSHPPRPPSDQDHEISFSVPTAPSLLPRKPPSHSKQTQAGKNASTHILSKFRGCRREVLVVGCRCRCRRRWGVLGVLDYSVGLTFSYRSAAALRGVCVCGG